MLLEFSLANFRSFKELQTLSLAAAKITSKYKELDENNVATIETVNKKSLKILKSKGIYGANASGKSNLIRGLNAFIKVVQLSIKDEKIIQRLVNKFELNTFNADEPTYFQLIFLIENEVYRYGFEIKEGKIISEWLFGIPKRVEVNYFIREGMNVDVNMRVFKEAKKFEDLSQQGDNEIFRDNSLFLSAVSVMGGKLAKSIIEKITCIGIVNGIDDPSYGEIVKESMISEDENRKQEIIDLLRSTDVGIDDIGVVEENEDLPENFPDELKVLFKAGKIKKAASFYSQRTVYDSDNKKIGDVMSDFNTWESEGTKKIFYLSPMLINTLKSGNTLIIDEFDARLHPLLTKRILQLFNSNKTNPNNSQLIFVTHDVALLKNYILRKDQMCLINKDLFGASTISTVVEFKGLRNDASIDKEYMKGKLGGVPFLNNMDKFFLN